MVSFIKSDLQFILDQIQIAEAHAAGADLSSLLPNAQVPLGLRTVDGSFNNLAHPEYGSADQTFPRLTTPVFGTAEAPPPGFGPPGAPATSYAQTSGSVFDSEPRTISNLIVDQTDNNPAAVAARDQTPNAGSVTSPGLDGIFGTADDKQVNFIPNATADAGLSAPFNAWMTFFGQFFDHGLDLVTKGGSGTVFIPLKPDDPLYNSAHPETNFMVLTRATNLPGPDGVLGTSDDIHEQQNTTTPFVDQNQTYSSHPSHQVFLRAYELDAAGRPVATGELIENRNLGADGKYGTADDVVIGGMATWAVVKAQARDFLGINLTDANVFDVPLLATDAYGNFIKGTHGMPTVMMKGGDGVADTADDFLVEGNRAAPISLANAVTTGHQFLIDIAHEADPSGGATPDSDSVIGGSVVNPATGLNVVYDNELLNAHYIAGDGRVNENIGLTTVHAVFHSEHNRLVEQTKQVVVQSGDLAFLNQWLLAPVASFPTSATQIDALHWNGERLFQVAKFGTEMQYQHLVFEEFARTVQPQVDEFLAPNGYDTTINPAIVAEFAHTVYRFGHSMLTETVDRFDPDFNPVTVDPLRPTSTEQLGLIAAFLNPLAYAASGPTPEQATGAIVRGLTRTVGNEIDEFVTEALRNNLVGLPLDLAVLNIARGRDVGIPSLNAARREFHAATGDSQLTPYSSWADFSGHLKHPESLINFIAAYGTHAAITSATTLAGKRDAATLLVLGDGNDADGVTIGGTTYNDRLAFLNSTGAWANLANGVTKTGLDDVDFWIGGLAEAKMPFGGMLGSSFNFVFENQLEKLQDGDRFYYLERTAGLAFNAELESNSFAKLIMANTDVKHLSALVFSTPTWILEVDPAKQFTGLGSDGKADPTSGDPLDPLVIRNNPATPGTDTNYLRYTGEDHVVLGGTSGNDIILSGDGDDTVYGDEGNDRIDGGNGNDQLRGGAGDDIITDLGGDDNIQGGDGNDVIQGGNGVNLLIGGFGSDFIITGEDASEAIGGQGNDFILGSKANEQDMGNEGDDWIEKGTSDGAPGDNFDPLGNDPIVGNDVFIGDGENDKFNGEGGDDIMLGGAGLGNRYIGGSGYDWASFDGDPTGVYIDISDRFFDVPAVPGSGASALARFDIVEGISGSGKADVLNGDDSTPADLAVAGATGSILTQISLIDGMQDLLDDLLGGPVTSFDGGNIILGGGGSDRLMGRGGDDLIDGDASLNVRISVRQNNDGSGPEIASFDSMVPLAPFMLAGTYKPGQLKIVREIEYATGPAFDTAVFGGNQADYTIAQDDKGTEDINDDVFTVTDNVGTDGTDTLRHIERLQFADGTVIIDNGPNHEPVGAVSILDAVTNVADGTPALGQVLRASIAGVTDGDNPNGGAITGPVAYFWQIDPGTGVFEDIVIIAAGEVARVEGPTFTPTADQLGLNLRVRAVYKDANGVLEEVYSAPTAAVDITPSAPTITSIVENGGGGINASEAANGTPVLVNIAGTNAQVGSILTINWGGFSATKALTLAEISAGAATVTVPASVISGRGDGTFGVTARLSATSGNNGPHSVAFSVTVDTVADTAPAAKVLIPDRLISSSDASAVSFTVSGLDADATAIVQFTVGAVTLTSSVSTNGTFSRSFAGLPDGTVSTSMLITDAAGNTTTTTGQGTVLNTSSSLFLSGAQFNALGAAQLADYATVTLLDGPGLISLTSAAKFAEYNTAGIDFLQSISGSLTLSLDQYSALGAIMPTGDVTLRGTGPALAALAPTDIAALAGRGIDHIASTTNAITLSVAQFQALGSVTLIPQNVVTLSDTGDALATLDFATLAAKGVDKLDSTSPLNVTIGQALSLGTVALTPADTVTAHAPAAEISALTASQISSLATKGIDALEITSGVAALSRAQYQALKTMTVSGDVTLADSGTQLSAMTLAQWSGFAAAGIDRLDATNDTLSINTVQLNALGPVTLTAGDLVTLSDTGIALAALTSLQVAGLASKGVDRLDATTNALTLNVAQFQALGSVALTPQDVVTLSDTGIALATLDFATLAARGVDKLDATDSLTITLGQVLSMGTVALTPADVVTVRDTAASISALSTSQLAALAAKGVDVLQAISGTVTLSRSQYQALGAMTVSGTASLVDTSTQLSALTLAQLGGLAATGIDSGCHQ